MPFTTSYLTSTLAPATSVTTPQTRHTSGASRSVSSIGLNLAFDAFARFGGSANPLSYKLFARGIAQGYAFGYTKTAFEVLISSVNAPGVNSIQDRLYVSLVGKVLVDYSKEIPSCRSWSYPLYKSLTYVLLQFTYSNYTNRARSSRDLIAFIF